MGGWLLLQGSHRLLALRCKLANLIESIKRPSSGLAGLGFRVVSLGFRVYALGLRAITDHCCLHEAKAMSLPCCPGSHSAPRL